MSNSFIEYNAVIFSALKPFLNMPIDAKAVKSAIRSSIENSLLVDKADYRIDVDKENRTVSVNIITESSTKTQELNFIFS